MYLIMKFIYGINYFQTYIYKIIVKDKEYKNTGLLIIVARKFQLEFDFGNTLIKKKQIIINRKLINNFSGMPL